MLVQGPAEDFLPLPWADSTMFRDTECVDSIRGSTRSSVPLSLLRSRYSLLRLTALPHTARAVQIAIDPQVGRSLPEIRYTLRTLFATAGLPIELVWYDAEQAPDVYPDVYYGPRGGVGASVTIPSVSWEFQKAPEFTPDALVETGPIPQLLFEGGPSALAPPRDDELHFSTDVLFTAFWLLTGPEETRLSRDKSDNLDAASTSIVRLDLLARPLVSMLAKLLADHFAARGKPPMPWPWAGKGHAVALSHDVDYPEIIRWIEMLRSIADGQPGRAASVALGRSHFWKFQEWIDLADSLGGRPAFYFMARRGSLYQYARGRPDAFYDIETPRFRDLFRYLADQGCEIGLHASWESHLGADRLKQEREKLEQACGLPVRGNRHHYWRLDPDAPHETLRRHGVAGLTYDSSLAFETHPGFRRGICHPFRAYHTDRREAIDCVQVPPGWMDDHFHRRREINGIQDPEAAAARILHAVRSTAGALVLDYHPRGMNEDFFPEYGPWLRDFSARHLQGGDLRTPIDLAQAFLERETALDHTSLDRTQVA